MKHLYETPSEHMLDELERLARRLWTAEPECNATDRPEVLRRVSEATMRVDRLTMRREHAARIDLFEYDWCHAELHGVASQFYPDIACATPVSTGQP